MHMMDIFSITKRLYHSALLNFLLCIIIVSETLVNKPTTSAGLRLGSETDRLALLAVKDKLTRGLPEALPSWNDSLHFCEWHGVICSSHHMRVAALDLTDQNFGGTIAPALGNLTFLKLLNLSLDNLHGRIPKEIGRLKRLQRINLSGNNLEGEIPKELTNCSKLEFINFYSNNLTGRVPIRLGSMKHLTYFSLGTNNLVGTIPPSLGNLSSLNILIFSYNHLEGILPHSLGLLSNLKVLYVGVNFLSGLVPPSIYNLSNIERIDLSDNHIEGALPSNIDLLFPKLESFSFALNVFTGTIPSSITNISNLKIFDFVGCRFSGPTPTTFGRLKYLQALDMDFNNLGSGRDSDLDFLSSLTNCSQLQMLTFQGNRFGGALPDLIGNFSAHLSILLMGENQISGTIPEAIGQLVGLTFLDMEFNLLEGTIPVSIGKLKNLGRVFFRVNRLSGNIPYSIGNLSMLFDLHLNNNTLEGGIPLSLSYCTNMQHLNLSQNNLSGNIPHQIFARQQSLITLDLSLNSLIGPVPSEFGKMKQLGKLYLQENLLSGGIPSQLGECSGLEELVMSGNLLNGSIPSSFGSLKSLEILDLSRNNLSGTIPAELGNLSMSKKLNLSFNHLHGEIPFGGVFSNITALSLYGNEDLCGGIPQLKLPACPVIHLKKAKKPLHLKVILIIVVTGAFLCSVISIIILYITKKPKRYSTATSSENRFLMVSYVELHAATNGFSSTNLIGTGSFGSVYKGTLSCFSRPIAVKVLNLQTRGSSKSFVAECRALARVRHRNLVKIVTCCSSIDYKGADFKALVFEFMPNGSLENWLHNQELSESENQNLNLIQRLDVAIDIAQALDYLHNDSEEVIVHCDIKPNNIFLDADMVAHLGDFGLARLLVETKGNARRAQATSSIVKGTIGYIPPEYGMGSTVSTKGDIYSYGILLLEMIVGRKPTDSMFSENLSLHKTCKMALLEGLIEQVDPHLLVQSDDAYMDALVSFARIGVACSSEFPYERMGIKDVIVELLAIKKRLSCPQGITIVSQN
ncbi:hypothetical protein L6164_005457 [Bauhinia variegata]|uniref:Uncharacterized protein n=1 Tax=Bauhinia variegata TaxID=167791 RepID=A0ACB9PQP0_BAUVA|nr:hypothetical protein L6164_005457 [Bauhinia variegata]